MALALTLALGAALPLWLRVCGLAALLPAAWLGCQLLRQRSGSAVQRLGWAPACGWWLQTVAGQRHYVQPDARAQSLGPWLLLVFRDGPTRFFILLDRLRAEPRACAALQALFALQTQRRQG